MRTLIITLSIVLISLCTVFSQNSKTLAAVNYYKAGEFVKAKQAIDEACAHEETKNNAKAWYLKGFIYSEMARKSEFADMSTELNEQAFIASRKSMELDKEKKYQNDNERALLNVCLKYFNTGVEYYDKGMEDGSKPAFKKALYFFDKYFEAFDLLGPEKKEMTDFLARNGIAHNDIYGYAGLAAHSSDDLEGAKKYYSKIVELKANDPVTYINYSKILFDEGNIDGAIKVIETARDEWPGNEDFTLTELNIYLKARRLEEYAEKLEEAKLDHPDNSNIFGTLAHAYSYLHKNSVAKGETAKAAEYRKKAEQNYIKAISLGTDNKKLLYKLNFNLGLLYYNPGVELHNKAIDSKDENKILEYKKEYNDLFEKALVYFKNAFEIDNQDKELVNCFIKIYMIQEDHARMNEFTNQLKFAH